MKAESSSTGGDSSIVRRMSLPPASGAFRLAVMLAGTAVRCWRSVICRVGGAALALADAAHRWVCRRDHHDLVQPENGSTDAMHVAAAVIGAAMFQTGLFLEYPVMVLSGAAREPL
jgi:hypothetical protein